MANEHFGPEQILDVYSLKLPSDTSSHVVGGNSTSADVYMYKGKVSLSAQLLLIPAGCK